MSEIPFAELPEALSKIADHIEYAGVLAMTRTAYKARTAAQESLSRTFILRNKYEMNSIRYEKATRQDPTAEVYTDSRELRDQEEGATRQSSKDFKIPIDLYDVTSQDQRKVIAKNLRAGKILNKRFGKIKPHLATIGNVKGVWLDTADGIRLLYDLRTSITIKRKPWFYDATIEAYEKNIQPEYDRAYDEQLEEFFLELI